MDGEADELQLRWQRETAEWRERVLAAAQASPDYSGAELKNEAQELAIYPVGPPTESMAALILDAAPNLRIAWYQAPYSLAELTAEVHRLMAAHPARLNRAGARHDGTGIEVATTDTVLLSSDDPQSELNANYPIRVEFGEQPTAC